MIGGLIPLVQFGRHRYVTETSWHVEVTWFRTRFTFEVTR